MKRFLCLLLCITMVCGMFGCSPKQKPDVMVNTFCEAMQTFDLETMQACLAEPQEGAATIKMEAEGSFELSFLEIMKEYAGQMEYEIRSSDIEKDRALVVVDFTYQDAAPVVTAAIGEFISQALALALGGADDQMLETAFAGVLLEKKDTIDTSVCEITVIFDCVLVDGEWKITKVDDNIRNILTSNILTAMEGFSEINDSTQANEDIDNTVWCDVPMGTEIELATIKVCVTDCIEAYAIITDSHRFDADEGTKYIVFTVKIENTTNEPLYLDSETFPLYDLENRNFDPWDDAEWYMDNIIYQMKLSPNMPEEGIVVYNVPADTSGYYFEILKRDTNNVYRFYGGESNISSEISYAEETEPVQSEIEEENSILGYVMYDIGGGLNIRSGPGVDYEKVGSLPEGEQVIIWETQYSGTAEWGRIERGWICMDYIQIDVPTSELAGISTSGETFETDFFFITLPDDWNEKYVLEHNYSARSEYLVFYYKSEYEYYKETYSEPGGWPFAIEIRADGTECSAIAGWEHIGSINVYEDAWYELYLHYPMDPQFMDGSYNGFIDDARSIIESITVKDGYAITLY